MKKDAREERALEAVLVLACLENIAEDMPDLWGPEPVLDPSDEQALQELGSDLVRRILEER
jgi:hypothetical protein